MTNNNSFYPPIVFHPGETLAEKLQEMEISVDDFTMISGLPEEWIVAIVSGEKSILPEIAVQLELGTKISASFWQRLQESYDEYVMSRG